MKKIYLAIALCVIALHAVHAAPPVVTNAVVMCYISDFSGYTYVSIESQNCQDIWVEAAYSYPYQSVVISPPFGGSEVWHFDTWIAPNYVYMFTVYAISYDNELGSFSPYTYLY